MTGPRRDDRNALPVRRVAPATGPLAAPPPEVPVHRRRPALAALAVLSLVALPACSGGGSDDTAAGSRAPLSSDSGGGTADQAAGGQPPAGDAGGGAAAPALARVTVDGAALIRTGELSVRVDDVRRAADRATELVRTAGGVLDSEEAAATDAHLRLRVPPARFEQVMGQLAGLGEEQTRRVATEDVTDQVVDLESRLASQRASVARVRALLDRAEDLGEVVQVEAELTKRTADLEALQARLDALSDRVALATVALQLTGSGDGSSQEAVPVGFRDGLDAGWTALVTLSRALAATAGAVLPFAPLLLVAVLVWRVRGRRAAA